MQTRTTHAGGFLLILAIFTGFAGGIATGQLLVGSIIGLAAGIALAVAVWLIDRRRSYATLRPAQITRPMQCTSFKSQSGQSE